MGNNNKPLNKWISSLVNRSGSICRIATEVKDVKFMLLSNLNLNIIFTGNILPTEMCNPGLKNLDFWHLKFSLW